MYNYDAVVFYHWMPDSENPLTDASWDFKAETPRAAILKAREGISNAFKDEQIDGRNIRVSLTPRGERWEGRKDDGTIRVASVWYRWDEA